MTNPIASFLKLFLGILLFLFGSLATGQDLDSLAQQYDLVKGTSRALPILKVLSEEYSDIDKKLEYAEELMALAGPLDSFHYVVAGHLQKGNALRLRGDLSEALNDYLSAAAVCVTQNMQRDLGLINVAIADVYSIMGNHRRSINYYRKAIQILRAERDSINLASAIMNAGDDFYINKKLDSALHYFQESGVIFNQLNYEVGEAYNLGNIGLVLAELDRHEDAELNISEAVNLLKKHEEYHPICEYLTIMSDIYLEKNEVQKALEFADESLELATQYGLKEQISDANLKLSEIHEFKGDLKNALNFYKEYVRFRDSVVNVTTIQEIANIQTEFEVSQKQIEVDLLNEQRRNQRLIVILISIALFLLGLFAFALYRRFIYIRKTKNIIEHEKNRSDHLLLNILPQDTATELKKFGKVRAKKFDQVSVLFTDFKDFTPHAEHLAPEELVETVDYYFSKFDEIMEKHGVEKIKTIGDAYMAAAGLPFPVSNHAHRIIRAAQDIILFMNACKENPKLNHAKFDIRIGVNSGPTIAGVVGTKKFAYDIWGNTVNIAARVESNSEPGQISISEHTYGLVKDKFECIYRGEIQLKNSEPIKMFYVLGEKTNQDN